MRKSSRRPPFGWSNRGGAVTVIETRVARSYRRRALVAFVVTFGVVSLLAGTVACEYLHPIVGFLLGVVVGAACGVVVFALVVAWPVLRVFWHWLPEILLAAGLVYGWSALMQAANPVVSALVLVVAVGVPAAVGPIRRRLAAWVWCLIVRHRLRLCFASFIALNRDGSLPLILLARATPAGERVWVWLRPGLALKDLEADGLVQRLAVACWASEVRVMAASRRYAGLVRVDITRRDPLVHTIASPLPGHVRTDMPADAPVSGMPSAGLDLPDVPDEPVTTEPGRRKPRNPSAASSRTRDGFDPCDYA